MALFKKCPPLQAFSPPSSPPGDIVHTYENNLSESERAAKRRRINEYAKDYLKGRDVFIASARLRGPFDNGWKNPWRVGRPGEEVRKAQATPVDVEMQDDTNTQTQRAIPETVARPSSKAGSGSDYCRDWLKRQDAEEYSPDLDSQFDVSVREAEEAASTPSKRQKTHDARGKKAVRLDVVPAWSKSQPNDLSQAVLSDLPSSGEKMNSMAVNATSSVAKRSVSVPAQARHDYRQMFKKRKEDVIDESSFVKVSAITEDLPQKRSRPVSRAKTVGATVPVDSPGFVFRRVEKGERPFSRGSDKSRASTTQKDQQATVEPHFASIDDVAPVEEAPIEEHQAEAPAIEEPAPVDDDIEDIYEDEAEEEPQESVTINVNADGKWPCPMPKCSKRPKPYAAVGGLKKHLKSKHGVKSTVTDAAVIPIAKAKKSKTKEKKKTRELELEMEKPVDVESGLAAMNEAAIVAALQGASRLSAGLLGVQEDAVMFDEVVDDAAAGVDTVDPAPEPAPEHIASSASALLLTAPLETNIVHSGEELPEVPGQEQEQESERDSVIPADEEPTVKAPELLLQPNPEPIVEEAAQELPTEAQLEPGASTTLPPDRQDSKAYSRETFTQNIEFNTQAALLKAHQAFADTQSSPEKPTDSQPTADHDTDITPFKRPDIPSFFRREVPGSMSKIMPANTQDLMAAAENLEWSTVKKPAKKRISFADWGQSKPSQPLMEKASMKPVEWSPYVDTPLTAVVEREKIVNGDGTRDEETPVKVKSAMRKSSSLKKSSLSASFSVTYDDHDADSPKLGGTEQEQFAQVPKSSEVPVPSFEPAQAAHEDEIMNDVGMEAGEGMDAHDLEGALDDMDSYLSTWNVDEEIRRESVRA